MTEEDIKAALALAAEAKDRADELTRDRPPREFRRLVFDDVQRIDRSLNDVPALADLVRRLTDELLTVRAVLSDATSESRMYEQGVRDALAAVEQINCLHPVMADTLGLLGKSVVLAVVRALLTPPVP